MGVVLNFPSIIEYKPDVIWSRGTISRDFTQVNIPNGVTSIGDYAFSDFSSLARITFPDSVTSIGNGAFMDCLYLERITIPDSVTSIGNSAFLGCSSLENIYYKGTEEQWNAITKGSDWNANMGFDIEGGTVITYNYTG